MFENLYAPYPYPYAAQQQPVPTQQQQKVPIVSGESGVRSEQLAPDSSKLYLDESGSKLWVAVTNNRRFFIRSPSFIFIIATNCLQVKRFYALSTKSLLLINILLTYM